MFKITLIAFVQGSWSIFEYQLIVGIVNYNYTSYSGVVFETSFLPMAYEYQAISSFYTRKSKKKIKLQRKTIPYPEFEPGTYRIAFGNLNHCTIGLVFRKFKFF
jgi:hypothetical protein